MCSNAKVVRDSEAATTSRTARRLTATIALAVMVAIDMLMASWIQLNAQHRSTLTLVIMLQAVGVVTLAAIWSVTGLLVGQAQPEQSDSTMPPAA